MRIRIFGEQALVDGFGKFFNGPVKSQKSSVFVIPVNAGIQEHQMLMDSRSPIRERTSFAGVTGLGTFYEFIKLL